MRECFHFERNIFGLRYYEFHFIGVLTFFLLYAKLSNCTHFFTRCTQKFNCVRKLYQNRQWHTLKKHRFDAKSVEPFSLHKGDIFCCTVTILSCLCVV